MIPGQIEGLVTGGTAVSTNTNRLSTPAAPNLIPDPDTATIHRSPFSNDTKMVAARGGFLFLLDGSRNLAKIDLSDHSTVWTKNEADHNFSWEYGSKEAEYADGYIIARRSNDISVIVYDVAADSEYIYQTAGKDFLSCNSWLTRNLSLFDERTVLTTEELRQSTPPIECRFHRIDHTSQEVQYIRSIYLDDSANLPDSHGIEVIDGRWIVLMDRDKSFAVWDLHSSSMIHEKGGSNNRLANGTKITYSTYRTSIIVGEWGSEEYIEIPLRSVQNTSNLRVTDGYQ